MSQVEKITLDEDPGLKRFYDFLDKLGEAEIKRMFLEDEISLVLANGYVIEHDAGEREERFYRVISDVNQEEGTGAIVIGVSRRFLEREDALLLVAGLVIELEDGLNLFKQQGLVLTKLQDPDSVQEVISKKGLIIGL